MPLPVSNQTTRVRSWAYANGNLGKSALSSMMDVFAMFYMTTALNVSGALAGAIIFASMFWDALTDPLIGYWADHRRAAHQTATRYFALGGPIAVAAFLLFFLAQFLPQDLRVIAAVFGLLVFRAGYALVDVPHNGLLPTLAASKKARTDISGMRIMFSAVGKLCVTVMAAGLLDRHPGPESGLAFAWIAAAMAVVFGVSLAICGFAVRTVSLHLENVSDGSTILSGLVRSFRDISALRTMFLLTAINSLMTPGIAVVMIYVSRYELGNAALGAQAVLIQALAQAGSLLFWNFIVGRLGSRSTTLMIAYGLLALVTLLGAFGLTTFWRMQLVAIGSGFAMGGIFMLNWALLPDALDVARRQSASRALLSYFGLYTIVNKALHGVAQASIGLALAVLGFTAAAGFPAGQAQSFQTALFALPVAGALACIVLLVRTRFTRSV